MTLIRIATKKDIELLIQLRMDFFTMMGSLAHDHHPEIMQATRDYLELAMQDASLMAFLAYQDQVVTSTIFMEIGYRLPSLSAPFGRVGTLLNVMTYPAYQNQGIAKQLLTFVLKEASNRGLSILNLLSTENGEALYRSAGFEPMPYLPMRICL